jgi:hypothetical protein
VPEGLAVSLLEPGSEVLGGHHREDFDARTQFLEKGFHLKGYIRCLVDVDHPVSASGTIRGSEVRYLRLEGLKCRPYLLPDRSVPSPSVFVSSVVGTLNLSIKRMPSFLLSLALTVGSVPAAVWSHSRRSGASGKGMLLLSVQLRGRVSETPSRKPSFREGYL